MAERPACSADDVAGWFAGRLPDEWFAAPLEVRVDRDEILVTGTVAIPTGAPEGEAAAGAAARSRIDGFREDTRTKRMQVAEVAQHKWRRQVSWAVRCGEVEERFTTASVPVMTRLRMDDRATLDTLIDAGVARSRSEAMAWCVAQVGQHQDEWLGRLRDAMTEVEKIRAEGPGGS